MALNIEQLTKVARLIESDIEHEALAAIRMTQKLLAKDGHSLTAVLEAGISAISSGKASSPFPSFFGGAPSHERSSSAATASERRKSAINVDIDSLPEGFFNATLTIQTSRQTRTKEPMLVVDVSHENSACITRYPTMCAFGDRATEISRAAAACGGAVAAMIKVRRPQGLGHLPSIVSIQL
ncbi:MAG: hypothetical protein DI537_10385 [Stutzerimonas stutzeri]|nr:MAG: hypothetical protein DI537_10385 [Stutzerimonas stutzeri]